MDILIVGGFLGSGKTTNVIRLGKYYSDKNKRVAIIVNEVGEIGIDGDIIQKFGLNTKEITAGCICCSLKTSIRTTIQMMNDNYEPDLIIIEPTGIAYPGVIRREVELMNLTNFKMLPLVTLFDGSRFKRIMKEIKRFATGQIEDADIIAISKSDLIEPIMIPIIEESLRQMNPDATITTISSKDEESFQNLVNLIEKNKCGEYNGIEDKEIEKPVENTKKRNEESFVENNEIFQRYEKDSSLKDSNIGYIAHIYCFDNENELRKNDDGLFESFEKLGIGIKNLIVRQNPDFIGHFKMYLNNQEKTYKISITSPDEGINVDIIDNQNINEKSLLKVFIATSGSDPEDIKKDLENEVFENFKKYGPVKFK